MSILIADDAFLEPTQSTQSVNRANFLVVPKLLGKNAEQSLADSGGNFLPIELVMTGKRFNLIDASITPCDGVVQTLRELSTRGLTGGRNQAEFLADMVLGYQNASRRIDALNPVDPWRSMQKLDSRDFYSGGLIIDWEAAEPVVGGHLSSTNTPYLEKAGGFSNLFFCPASEAWAAEKEKRIPLPAEFGSLRLGHRDLQRDNQLRWVDVENGRQTGWEVSAKILDVWHGKLSKTPEDFARAAGFPDSKTARKDMVALYRNLGRSINAHSDITGVICEPARRENIGYRPPAEAKRAAA